MNPLDPKEIFDKIEKCVTEALNKEEGIMLDGKVLEFKKLEKVELEDKISIMVHHKNDPGSVTVFIYQSDDNHCDWHINIFGTLYIESAILHTIEELQNEFNKDLTKPKAMITRNQYYYSIKDSFEIRIYMPHH